MQPKRLSVLGVGLLGGSLGLAAKETLTGCTVAGYGHRASTLQAALERGAIDEAYADPVEAVRGADLVVLCTPVGMLGELLSRIAPTLERGAIVTDVGSTKRLVVAAAAEVLSKRTGPYFVGSHPMAGSEKRGVQHAQADLFQGAVCILTPDASTDPTALERVDAFWRRLGMRTTHMSPDDHDREIATVSHVPHALAAALVHVQSDASLALAGKGFVDVTRIAGGDGGLWRDILAENRDNVRAGVDRLQRELATLLQRLDAGEADAVAGWLDAAAERRRRLIEERSQRAGGE